LPSADLTPSRFTIEALVSTHQRTGFDSGVAALDQYLTQQAGQDAKRHVAAPFVMREPPANEVLGYYTLSASAIDVRDLPLAIAKKMPRYASLPVVLMGRLALASKLAGLGLGEFLLMDALQRSARAEIAAMAFVVDAKDEMAQAFYQHFDFMPLQQQPRRLFLPMSTIKKLFPD
jgi:ribosomal protein S18 acetylase RimI-like enzyme